MAGIRECPSCRMRVIPKPDGKCPSCQMMIEKPARAMANSASPAADEAPPETVDAMAADVVDNEAAPPPAEPASEDAVACTAHPEVAASFYCEECGEPFCDDCLCGVVEIAQLCTPCADRLCKEEVGFCTACFSESDDRDAGNMLSLQGCGFTFYGERDKCQTCWSSVRTKWLTLFAVPLLPLGSYRVKSHKVRETFVDERFLSRRVPMQWGQVLRTYLNIPLVLLAIALVLAVIFGISTLMDYLNVG